MRNVKTVQLHRSPSESKDYYLGVDGRHPRRPDLTVQLLCRHNRPNGTYGRNELWFATRKAAEAKLSMLIKLDGKQGFHDSIIGRRVVRLGTEHPVGTIADGDPGTGRWDVEWSDGTRDTVEGPQLQSVD